jgi:hypothetical protein
MTLKIQRKKSVYALCKEIIPWSWAFLLLLEASAYFWNTLLLGSYPT